MDFRKITRISIAVFIALTFLVSLYFNYMYFKEEKQVKEIEKTKETIIINKQLVGIVVDIDKNNIKIHDGQNNKDIDIKITDKTSYSKMYLDSSSLEPKEENAQINDIKEKTLVFIDLIDVVENQNYTASGIKYQFVNYHQGNVLSISEDKIMISLPKFKQIENNEDEKPNDSMEIKINTNTEYYKTTMTNIEDNLTQKAEKMEKMNRDEILENDYIYCFYPEDILINPTQSANKTIVTK